MAKKRGQRRKGVSLQDALRMHVVSQDTRSLKEAYQFVTIPAYKDLTGLNRIPGAALAGAAGRLQSLAAAASHSNLAMALGDSDATA
jgi:hypothetical protein